MTARTLPPGIEGDLTEVSSGGTGEWLAFKTRKWYTNAFIITDHPNETRILLGYKKRGFGMGLYNGFGGKVDPGETTAQAALRELKEECGVDAPLEHCGSLLFVAENGPDWAFQIEVYRSATFSGTVIETDEMRPQWFSVSKATSEGSPDATFEPIPYDTMWADDIHWMPLMLAGKSFVGRADFNDTQADKPVMKRWWFGVPSS